MIDANDSRESFEELLARLHALSTAPPLKLKYLEVVYTSDLSPPSSLAPPGFDALNASVVLRVRQDQSPGVEGKLGGEWSLLTIVEQVHNTIEQYNTRTLNVVKSPDNPTPFVQAMGYHEKPASRFVRTGLVFLYPLFDVAVSVTQIIPEYVAASPDPSPGESPWLVEASTLSSSAHKLRLPEFQAMLFPLIKLQKINKRSHLLHFDPNLK